MSLRLARVGALIGFALAIVATHVGNGVDVRRDQFRVPGWAAGAGERRALRVWRYAARSPPPMPAPAVIVLHGYFASARMFERLYAEELVRRGIVVFAPEDLSEVAFATRTVPDQARLAVETAPLVALLEQVRRDPGVDPERVGLLGHSFGASLALETACADWSVRATVSMSASLHAAEYVNHVCPRDLLLIHGDADRFTGERHQEMLFERATRGFQPEGLHSGNTRRGDARALVVVPGAGHLTLLWNTRSRQAAIDWLVAALDVDSRPEPVVPFPARRLVLCVLALIATVELWSARRAAPDDLDRRTGGDAWMRSAVLLGVAGVVLMSGWLERLARTVATATPPSGLDGAGVFVSTLALAAVVVLPLALPAGALRGVRRWHTRPRRTGWRATIAVAAGRAAMAYLGLRVMMTGFYDPTPRVSHLIAAGPAVVIAFLAFLILAAARRAIDDALPRTTPGLALGAVRLVAVALLLRVGLWPLSTRYDDLTAAAIELVPFSLALIVLAIVLTPGRRGEPVLDRAIYGTVVALLVLTTVFPRAT